MGNHSVLEPSKKLLHLINRLYNIKDKRLIKDKLREIRHEVIASEVQHNNLTIENRRLIFEANQGQEDPIIPF